MGTNEMILAEGVQYSLDCYETRLNNNVLVVGTSGAGKTRSIVTPNLLQATGSYIISDPKGNLYDKYKGYLESNGYVVRKLDFTDPGNSCHYNFFHYIHSTQDIVKIAHMLIGSPEGKGNPDPYWEETAQIFTQSIIGYLYEEWDKKEQNLANVLELMDLIQNGKGDLDRRNTPLDKIMEELEEKKPDSFAVKQFHKFRVAPEKTLRCTIGVANAKLGLLSSPELLEMTKTDDVDFPSLGEQKTALFVVVSDTDRALDNFVNLFFTQAMNELCLYADKNCKDCRLPIPVRFILDDFATNCKIAEFPRMIASIRSRGISTMLMIQAEAQLTQSYGEDGATIIGNCDTYIYLGGNDIRTAQAVAERCDVPLRKILYMPVGTNWIFRRGQEPINGINYDLEKRLSLEELVNEQRAV